MLEEVSQDFDLNFALGLLKKRRGDFLQAKEAYEAALLLDPTSSLVHNNLGNVYFATEDHEKAIEMYERAAQLDPQSGMPHYNLAQVYQRTLRFKEATAERKKASELDFQLVRSSAEIATEHFNRAVVDGVLSPQFLWQEVFHQLWRWEDLKRSPLRGLSISAAISLLSLLLLSKFLKKGELGSRCTLCGRPICVSCRGSFKEKPVCYACEWRISGAKSENIRSSLVEAIPRHSGILARVEAGILNILYPGTGHLFLGAVGRGIFYAFVASLLISHLFLINLAQGRSLVTSLGGLSSGKLVLLGILGLTWIWSLISVSRRKERPWPSREV